MLNFLSKRLIKLSKITDGDLFVVGGAVRNFLIAGEIASDIDLAGAISIDNLSCALDCVGYKVLATYKHTGTIVFGDGVERYEYTRFRTEEYLDGGGHVPVKTEFTADIEKDALRRDFKCNAVYYNVTRGEFCDPLDGIKDVKNKVLDTVKESEKVFRSDGLRLMRLARFAGELDFTPTEQTLVSAKKFSGNIQDVSPERVFAELKLILNADSKYSFSNKAGHYVAVKILESTGVLFKIIPELKKGEGIVQRKDYHDYDVLEHSLRCLYYAPKSVRLAALLHDVGKPYALESDGKFYNHPKVGQELAFNILKRLKADNQTIKKACFLVRQHMIDMDGKMRDIKVRKFIVENHEYIEDLLLLKQADYSGCKDDLSTPQPIIKWRKIYRDMLDNGTPFKIGDLKINGQDLIDIGFKGKGVGEELKRLFDLSVENSAFNVRETLVDKAKRDLYDKK